jgi:hypothetical protein
MMTNGCFSVKFAMDSCFDPKTAMVALIVLTSRQDGERRVLFIFLWWVTLFL